MADVTVVGNLFGEAEALGEIYYDAGTGEWVIGDTLVRDMLLHTIGAQSRIMGKLEIKFFNIPTRTLSGTSSMGHVKPTGASGP